MTQTPIPMRERLRMDYQWTARQKQVLELIARRRSNTEIAEALGISLAGAKWHVSEILSKLQADQREEAAEYWRRYNGLAPRFERIFRGIAGGVATKWVAGTAVGVLGIVAGTVLLAIAMSQSDDEPPANAEETPAATPTPMASPSASPSPTNAPGGGPGSGETSTSGETTSFGAYFFMDALEGDEPGGPFLVPVHREVPRTQAVASAALNALIAGPTQDEAAGLPSISSTLPAGTELLGVSVADGIADVNLSSEFESGGGSASVRGRLAQLTFTLTQFPTVNAIRLSIEGDLVTEFSSEGLVIDGPLTREDFEDLLPAIFVDSPRYGSEAANPMRLVGNANVFEATFQVTITDNDGLILVETFVTASCGTGCRGTFDITLPYTVTMPELGALIVFEHSAEDGSPQRIREYPVHLVPAD